MKKLVLIDGNSIAFRAFFALPLLNNDKGIYTNAVYGFTTMLLKVLQEEKPTHVLVAFDAGKTTFRHETYTEYKGGREKTPPELSEQLPVIREVLDTLKIARYEAENYEADDIIGTIAKRAQSDDWEVKVYSGDKDLLQLVSNNVDVALTRKGITNVDTYDVKAIDETYGFEPSKIIDMKGLMGDSSDNIPGVPGVGEKTALKLLKQFGSLEGVYEDLDSVSGKKMKEKLHDNREQAFMSKQLATIKTDVPIDEQLSDYQLGEQDEDQVISLFKELEFSSLLDQLGIEASNETDDFEELEVNVIDEIDEDLLSSSCALVVEVMDENYHDTEIVGISIYHEDQYGFIPTDVALQSEVFKNWAKDESKQKWVFSSKRAVVALGWHGIDLRGVTFDMQLASYLLDPSVSSHELADIAKRKGSVQLPSDEAIYGKGAKQQIPDQETLAEHLIRKASVVYRMYEQMSQELTDLNMKELFFDLEMPLSVILGKMEMNGVRVDVDELKQMGESLTKSLAEIEQEIHALAGEPFNINSPKQLGVILFERLELPVIKKTKTGYSTSADVLEKLRDEHEIVEKILHYRQLGKLNSTYIEGLLKVVHPNKNKIHTIFQQALTQTGRLSSVEPNLQNIPVRLEEGRKIRRAFVPDQKGAYIFAADYSQIELRVLAHICQDERLLHAFKNDMDIHTKTAMDVFDVTEEEVTGDMRRTAKAVNFGIVYGISDYGLSQNLGITRKEAKSFIDRYFESFPGVKAYMDDIVEKARENGYVTTMLNRRRYLPDITSRNFNKRSFAERTAMNTPIQGSAADIIKKAMLQISDRLEEEQLSSKMLLQVHDELIFEVPENELETMSKIVPEVMEQAIEIDVPLLVDVAYGFSWYDAK
ncbi:DNA polymerase I [Texcoconibacillus texcoconensis]|uniref:DNA polymerase I n=1 Tax=Texcoconibacillus texcoconensis TaxID=1095777 RepID=A0A840QMV7_9BACI|nr:DNA polymerase-1 [Texcoconibacillus texcoconensis]